MRNISFTGAIIFISILTTVALTMLSHKFVNNVNTFTNYDAMFGVNSGAYKSYLALEIVTVFEKSSDHALDLKLGQFGLSGNAPLLGLNIGAAVHGLKSKPQPLENVRLHVARATNCKFMKRVFASERFSLSRRSIVASVTHQK